MNGNVTAIGKRKTEIFCHFSFRRPKGVNYGFFAVAFYADFEGKKLITKSVRKMELWEDHQFVSAIQSYENALNCIHANQRKIRDAGIVRVFLVTDNSTLAGWIMNPKKNPGYTELMYRATKLYSTGAPKEITVDVGLCEPREYEKSYKYCKERYLTEENVQKTDTSKPKPVVTIKLDEKPKFVSDLIATDKSIPEYGGNITVL